MWQRMYLAEKGIGVVGALLAHRLSKSLGKKGKTPWQADPIFVSRFWAWSARATQIYSLNLKQSLLAGRQCRGVSNPTLTQSRHSLALCLSEFSVIVGCANVRNPNLNRTLILGVGKD